MHKSTREEVERCLPHFIRLCVQRSIDSDITIDTSALEVARSFYARFPSTISEDLQEHFTEVLANLVDLASALATRLSLSMLKDYAERASVEQVSALLERSLIKSLRTDT